MDDVSVPVTIDAMTPTHRYRSAARSVHWPALLSPSGAQLLAGAWQLKQSEWWTPLTLRTHQARQLAALYAHARRTVPWYAERYAAAPATLTPELFWENWQHLPILRRTDVQAAGEAMFCRELPPAHGPTVVTQTSGSTGRPITVKGTRVTKHFNDVLQLREHHWQRRDARAKYVAIRPEFKTIATNQTRLPHWGPPLAEVFATGPAALLPSAVALNEQFDWLRHEQPVYLLTLASNLRGLAEESLRRGLGLPGLVEARAYGECCDSRLRDLVRRAWNVPVTDLYSSQETGTIALQCPDHEHLHVQSENVLLEILRDDGSACGVGEIGRVVVSTLHNYASPLLRYENGDYAEVGAACACGRGLPVIQRVLGRRRNLAVTPGGQRYWPSFPSAAWAGIAAIHQIQFVQKNRRDIEVNYVAAAELTGSERADLVQALRGTFGHPYDFFFIRRDAVMRSGAREKYEDFICEIEE